MRVEMLSDHAAPREPWLPGTAVAARQLYGPARSAAPPGAVVVAPGARRTAGPRPGHRRPLRGRAGRRCCCTRRSTIRPAPAAGVLGQDPLTAALGVLPDDWVMLRGYRNRRGGTDHVLVGPHGIWAVEVERRRIRLHAVGDQWWWERLDAGGHSVETGRAVDPAGRAWPRQRQRHRRRPRGLAAPQPPRRTGAHRRRAHPRAGPTRPLPGSDGQPGRHPPAPPARRPGPLCRAAGRATRSPTSSAATTSSTSDAGTAGAERTCSPVDEPPGSTPCVRTATG